jgi:hypothetical protein
MSSSKLAFENFHVRCSPRMSEPEDSVVWEVVNTEGVVIFRHEDSLKARLMAATFEYLYLKIDTFDRDMIKDLLTETMAELDEEIAKSARIQ